MKTLTYAAGILCGMFLLNSNSFALTQAGSIANQEVCPIAPSCGAWAGCINSQVPSNERVLVITEEVTYPNASFCAYDYLHYGVVTSESRWIGHEAWGGGQNNQGGNGSW